MQSGILNTVQSGILNTVQSGILNTVQSDTRSLTHTLPQQRHICAVTCSTVQQQPKVHKSHQLIVVACGAIFITTEF